AAIDSFRSYLRDAQDLAAPERAEIEGYIAEMQRLQSSTPSPAGSMVSTAGSTTTTPAPPLTHRWWFWAGVGALVIAGVVVAVARTFLGGRAPRSAAARDRLQRQSSAALRLLPARPQRHDSHHGAGAIGQLRGRQGHRRGHGQTRPDRDRRAAAHQGVGRRR